MATTTRVAAGLLPKPREFSPSFTFSAASLLVSLMGADYREPGPQVKPQNPAAITYRRRLIVPRRFLTRHGPAFHVEVALEVDFPAGLRPQRAHVLGQCLADFF